MTEAEFAGQSLVTVYGAMGAYLLAFVAFAAFLSAQVTRAADVAEPALVGVDGGGVADGAVAGGSADGPDAAVKRPLGDRLGGVAVALTFAATALLAVAVGLRTAAIHRVPWGNMYEFAITGSFIVSVVYAVILVRPQLVGLPSVRSARQLGVFLTGPILTTLWAATGLWYVDASALRPALQDKLWMSVHVFSAVVASALFTIAFSVTVVQLVKSWLERRGSQPRWFSALPSSEVLEQVGYRLHAAAFPLWTFVLISGAIWAQKAWGRYWQWDPKEVWSFITFVVYAAYLHARATGGWSRRAAWFAVAGFACLMMNFGPVNTLFPGLHSYSGLG